MALRVGYRYDVEPEIGSVGVAAAAAIRASRTAPEVDDSETVCSSRTMDGALLRAPLALLLYSDLLIALSLFSLRASLT